VEPAHAAAAETFAQKALAARGTKQSEQAIVDNLTSYLRLMFDAGTPWIDHLVRSAQSQLKVGKRRRIADTLIGYTSVEWESDLRNPTIYATGRNQVKEHLAGLINKRAPVDKLVGVLSDTVRWEAYRIDAVRSPASGPLGKDDIDILLVEVVDLSSFPAGKRAEALIGFLDRWFGREGGHPLDAETIARDLGFNSTFGTKHVDALAAAVASAMAARPAYASQLQLLWERFVGRAGGVEGFDQDIYVRELYLGTLAKLICANVIERHPKHWRTDELQEILDGSYFRARGLMNLVEYDYFGWLHDDPAVLAVAEDMQRGLTPFDFEAPAAEDIFGRLFAQLVGHDRRVLLGQELTPQWLAREVAQTAVTRLPSGVLPRFLDPCCGSGALLIEVGRAALDRAGGKLTASELAWTCTGFDVDPLAVMIAKINWVVSFRDPLNLFKRYEDITIPVYLADSMFASTPVGIPAAPGEPFVLELEKHRVELPAFLLTPENGSAFDEFVSRGHHTAAAVAGESAVRPVPASAVSQLVHDVCDTTGVDFTASERADVEQFLTDLIGALADLERKKLNGIWSFVLRNSFRPALLAGEFNGLVMNPPWLAMSKLADNPFRSTIVERAAAYAIVPAGKSKLHAEFSTTFMLNAVDRYLDVDGVVATVLPETLLNGDQHTRFRLGAYSVAVPFMPDSIDRVPAETFKNNAIVLHGGRTAGAMTGTIPGRNISPTGSAAITFERVEQGDAAAGGKLIWTDQPGSANAPSFAGSADFREGADVLPRRAFFHEIERNGTQAKITPINKSDKTGPLYYLVADTHKADDLLITGAIPTRYVFPVLISKHLVSFLLDEPAEAFLPVDPAGAKGWEQEPWIQLAGTNARAVVEKILAHADCPDTYDDIWTRKLNMRGKLVQQRFPTQGYLAVFGAGGSYPAAAYAPLTRFDTDRLVVDQTLYWAVFDSEDEAVYWTGLFNSRRIHELILPFQPKGGFKQRHVHTLLMRFTPPYDATNPTHAAAVAATRQLLTDLDLIRASGKLPPELADLNVRLQERREEMRDLLTKLPSYANYDAACTAVYDDAQSPVASTAPASSALAP
jgi:hypothetical protein